MRKVSNKSAAVLSAGHTLSYEAPGTHQEPLSSVWHCLCLRDDDARTVPIGRALSENDKRSWQ